MGYIICEGDKAVSIPHITKKTRDSIRFEACIQTADIINRNRRRYSKGLLEGGIAKMMPRIKEGSLLGELDHPTDKNPVRQVTVHFKEASHRFLEIGWDGNKMVGIIETLRTPNGTILKNLAEDKIPVGFSFRGMGDLREVNEGGVSFHDVVHPLHPITWDSVSYPSHPEATITKITEGVSKQLHESVGYAESDDGYIRTEDGYFFLPNDFDRLVETRVIRLKDRYSIGPRRKLGDIEI